MDTVSRGEQVEADLDRLITKRHDQRAAENGHRPSEDLWQESVRTYNAKRREALCWEWLRFHARQLRNHELTSRLITAHHEQEIAKYELMLGINHEPREETA